MNDKWFRILAPLLPVLVVIYFNIFLAGFSIINVTRSLVSIGTIVLICEGTRSIIYKSRQSLRGVRRILVVLFAGICWISVLITVGVILGYFIKTGIIDFTIFDGSSVTLNHRSFIMGGVLGFSLLSALLIFPVLWTAYEIIFHFAQLRHTQEEKEKLEKEKLKAELQQLKGIINPHFLFNNLNSLSSLIAEDPESAQDFLDELTKVFRYLLRNNETDLTPLSQEMGFIKSYYNLLQTRYGKAIKMEIHIDEDYQSLLIPPLTLQLLVENAVKHNRLQQDNPLTIELVTRPGNKLEVRNNLLKREGHVESMGIGLQNINARYKMLHQSGVNIIRDERNFSAVIPLIEPGD